MNPWIIIGLIGAGIVFLIDFLVRRKKWNQNTKAEKSSLILNMVSVAIYIFTSVLGMLLGIVGSSAETAFGQILYDVTIVMTFYIGVVAFAAAIGSLILRKKGKIKASIWINVITLGYIIVLFVVNSLTGLM